MAQKREQFGAKGQRVKGQGFAAWTRDKCEINIRVAYQYITLFKNWNTLVNELQFTNEIFTLTRALSEITFIKKVAELEAQDELLQEHRKELEIVENQLTEIRTELQDTHNISVSNKTDSTEKEELEQRIKELKEEEVRLFEKTSRIRKDIAEEIESIRNTERMKLNKELDFIPTYR